MVERTKLIQILNKQEPIDALLIDFFCVEYNHKPEEINQLFNILNMMGLSNKFISCILQYYIQKQEVCSVQRKNPKYTEEDPFIKNLVSKWETIYYF